MNLQFLQSCQGLNSQFDVSFFPYTATLLKIVSLAAANIMGQKEYIRRGVTNLGSINYKLTLKNFGVLNAMFFFCVFNKAFIKARQTIYQLSCKGRISLRIFQLLFINFIIFVCHFQFYLNFNVVHSLNISLHG